MASYWNCIYCLIYLCYKLLDWLLQQHHQQNQQQITSYNNWKIPDIKWLVEQSNSKFKNKKNEIFQNGIYSGYYIQYGKKTSFYNLSLNFEKENWHWNSTKNYGKVTKLKSAGTLKDAIGEYEIQGHYCPRNGSLILQKCYVIGTGNRSENLGHIVRMRLKWNNYEKIIYWKFFC